MKRSKAVGLIVVVSLAGVTFLVPWPTRTAEGPPRPVVTQESPLATQSNRASAASTPATTATARPGITYRLGTGVSDADLSEIRTGTGLAIDYLSAELRGDPQRTVVIEVVATSGSGSCCSASGQVISFNITHDQWRRATMSDMERTLDREHTTAHEYVHTWQSAIGYVPRQVPVWLNEGMAEYIGWAALVLGGRTTATDARGRQVNNQATKDPSLRDILRRCEVQSQICTNAYSLFYLAVEQLTLRAGVAGLRAFCESVASGLTWPSAFSAAFGVPAEDFYVDFERYVERLR